MKTKISITINEKILRDIDSIIDNILIRNRSQALEYLVKEALKENKIAAILAGDSPRLNITDRIKNRYALKINGITLIERLIRKLKNSGFKNIYIIATHDILTNIFKIVGDGSDLSVKIQYVDEEIPEGTASAIRLLRDKVKTTFLVVHCDIIFDNVNIIDIWKKHIQEKAIASILIGSPYKPSSNALCGNVSLEGNKIVKYVQKPNKNLLSSSIFARGLYVFEPEIFGYKGKSLEFDIIPFLVKRRLATGYLSSTEHLHIHTNEDLNRVKRILKENDIV